MYVFLNTSTKKIAYTYIGARVIRLYLCIAIYSIVKIFWSWIRIVRLVQMLVDHGDIEVTVT